VQLLRQVVRQLDLRELHGDLIESTIEVPTMHLHEAAAGDGYTVGLCVVVVALAVDEDVLVRRGRVLDEVDAPVDVCGQGRLLDVAQHQLEGGAAGAAAAAADLALRGVDVLRL